MWGPFPRVHDAAGHQQHKQITMHMHPTQHHAHRPACVLPLEAVTEAAAVDRLSQGHDSQLVDLLWCSRVGLLLLLLLLLLLILTVR